MLLGNEISFFYQACICDFVTSDFKYDLNWYNWMKLTPHFSLDLLNPLLSHDYIEQFLDNIEDLSYFNNLENIQTIYHYSIPTTKLAYPEPFVASASFMHSDLWFVHILLYQYWLWFVFIFIVIFFFITFICTVRWCNMRVRPRRETRGVSRSKCGDLITACVPVSWAASIIINESTDAIDYYDGFGTTELVVGIRAYQWGWEYYYPKDIDLNYNLKHNYSSFIGNSLKYNATSDTTLKKTNFWRYYQNKLYDQVVTPAHLLLLPQDNLKLINFLNFNDIGENLLSESNAFKRTRMFFKNPARYQHSATSYFNNKYKFFSALIQKEESFLNSSAYGLQRQHAFLLSQTPFNDTTRFNHNSFFKFLNYNKHIHFSHLNKNLFTNLKFLQLNSKTQIQNYNFVFAFNFMNKFNFTKNLFYSHFKFLFNTNSDKKKISHPLFKTRLINKKNYFNNRLFVKMLKSNYYNVYNGFTFFNNSTKIYRIYDNFSTNQNVLTSSKFIRKHLNVVPTKSYLNFSHNINTWVDFNHLFNSQNSNILNIYNWYKVKWTNFNLFNKLGVNKIYFDSPHSPVSSNTPYYVHLNYDSLENTFIENTPSMFQSKEDTFPTYLFSIYWNFWNFNTTNAHRFLNNFNYIKNVSTFYLPLFTFYYDYDFRNWQTLELLEDAVWESTVNLFTYDEYKDLSDNFYEYFMPSKTYLNFFLNNKFFNFNENALDNPIETNCGVLKLNYGNLLYNDDLIVNLKFHKLNDYSTFISYNNLTNLDDTYEILKNFEYLTAFYKKNPLELNNTFFSFTPAQFAFDLFRSNYEDFYWFNNKFYLSNENFNKYNEINSKNNRFNNQIFLRSTVKNSIVNFNALQKVFKSRLDDSRSHSKLLDLSNVATNQPFLAAQRPLYEKLLGKNKEFFINYNFYQPKLFPLVNYDFSSFLNFPFFHFPFLLAQKSDSARHIWIDWYSKWGFYEVQPSSSSKYSIYGMPYFNKFFEFTYEQNDVLNETETYFVRISKARKNYLQNWIYTPYFYAKNAFWNKNTVFFELLKEDNKLIPLNFQLDALEWYWTDLNFDNSVFKFLPSISNTNSFTKSTWRPVTDIANYYYSFSVFYDILTTREYLYRELFSNTNKLINLPGWLINRSSNHLISDLKSTFFYNDHIIRNNEFSKDLYFNSLEFFNFNIFKTWIFNHTPASYHPFLNNFYLFSFTDKLTNDNEILYKNQYRPLRKGINNMIRLHATGAVALPIEIRLQVLASSKDVIHSWAVPSAGVKIDCVPGYSSHKVMIFLVSGIFWGQCMEICGRYHHWMPIVVYFMKRDLFFLWCTHFVFLSGSNNMWSVNDRQFVDYIKVVSYDKTSWINEIK